LELKGLAFITLSKGQYLLTKSYFETDFNFIFLASLLFIQNLI